MVRFATCPSLFAEFCLQILAETRVRNIVVSACCNAILDFFCIELLEDSILRDGRLSNDFGMEVLQHAIF